MRKSALATCLALLLVTLSATSASANDVIGRAQGMDATHNVAHGAFVGDSGGAFRYYAIDYPGFGAAVPITMVAQPGRGTAGLATGFKIYGPHGLFGEAIGDDRSTTESAYTLTISHVQPGRYFVQVYNFIHGLPMTYRLSASGLPSAGVATPVPTGGTTPGAAIVPGGPSITTGGTLEGSSGGSFAYFNLEYPGGQSPLSITLGYSPLPFNSVEAVGFHLYGDNGALLGTSAESGRGETSATEVFTHQNDFARRYLLQVFNYLASTRITYTLVITGLTGAIQEIAGRGDPGSALPLTASQSAVRSTLLGDRAGRFSFFTLPYPGGNRVVRVTVTFDPAGLSDGEVGFNLFKDASLVGTSAGAIRENGVRVAGLTINEADARNFGVQVYNYSASRSARYLITVTGL